MATSSLTAAAASTAKMPEYQDKSQFKITDLNPHLSCILCGGYFIDATTITECLHSFCRACIVRYLETSKYCPVCEVQIHKTRPLRCIRSDKMLQDIVYKLVPGLYQNEMKRRRELYASQPPEALKESRDAEDRGEGMEDRFIYTADEIFHLSVDYVHHNGSGVTETVDADPHRRFLKCPAALTIFHLKKFIRLKYSIPNKYQVDLRYQEEPLIDTYSLMDIAYIFAWKRKGLLSFSYRINEKPKKLTPRLRVVKPLQPEMKKDDVLKDSEIMPTSDSTATAPVVSDLIKCDTVEEKTVSETTHSSSVTDHEEDVISNSINPLPEGPKVNLTPIVSETPKPIVEKATKVYSGKNRKTSARSGKESSKRSSKKSHSSQSSSAIKRSLPKICVSFLNNNSRRTGDGYTSSSIAIVPPTRVRSSSEKKASVPPPKVPKLTIPLTPKILQDANSLQQKELQQQQLEQQDQQPEKPEPQQEQPQRLQQDEEQQQQQQQQSVLEDQDTKDDEKMDSDRDLFDGGPLVIAEPLEDSVESKDHKLQISDDDAKEDALKEADKMEEEIDVESCEVDSGRGSDTSCRTGDDDIGSPGSSTTVRTPDLDKSNPFPIPSPSSTASLPSPVSNVACHSYNIGSIFNGFSLASTLATTSSTTTTTTTLSPINGSMVSSNSPQNHQKDDLGVLDLSTCHRKRGHDRLPMSRPRQVANPPVLDKHRQTTPCLPLPSHPSFKLLPAVLPHTSIYKKNTSSDFCRGNFRCKGSTLTAYNPDPNSNRPKIVIKSIESPRAEHGHGRHHHHHGHHHSHHHQRM